MGSIFQHQHPTLLFRFPKLIYFSYGLNWLIRLRKWYIHAALLPLIRSTKKTSYVLDAGVGDGQFIIPYAKKIEIYILLALISPKVISPLFERFVKVKS